MQPTRPWEPQLLLDLHVRSGPPPGLTTRERRQKSRPLTEKKPKRIRHQRCRRLGAHELLLEFLTSALPVPIKNRLDRQLRQNHILRFLAHDRSPSCSGLRRASLPLHPASVACNRDNTPDDLRYKRTWRLARSRVPEFFFSDTPTNPRPHLTAGSPPRSGSRRPPPRA